jgi:hypothetical protein
MALDNNKNLFQSAVRRPVASASERYVLVASAGIKKPAIASWLFPRFALVSTTPPRRFETSSRTVTVCECALSI